MQLAESFNLMLEGKTCSVEDTEYRITSKFPPKLQSRPKGKVELDWEDRNSLGYLLYTMASNLWEVSDEEN
jgi:hypothetical protein